MTAPGPSIPDFAAASASIIHFHGRQFPVSDLAAEADRVARALTRLGIGRGDRVALWLPNCPEWFTIFFAIARIGAIAVMVNTRYRSAEVADIVSRSGAKALFLWPDFRGIDFPGILAEIDPAALRGLHAVVAVSPIAVSPIAVSPIAVSPIAVSPGDATPGDATPGDATPGAIGVPGVASVGYAAFAANGDAADGECWPATDALAGDGVAIFTTSGTTSRPKFVLHSQQNATRHAADVIAAFDMTKGGSPLIQTLPLCGVFGFCQALATIAADRPMLLEEAFAAQVAIDAVRDYRISHFFTTDDMLHAMLDLDESRQALRSLEMAGFAAFNGDPGPLMQRCIDHGVPLVGLYGMSEVMALFAAQPADAPPEQRIKGAGRPVCPETRVRVRDPETGDLLGPGEVGALEIRTPNRMLGYFQDEAATREAIDADCYLRTGDAGYLDDVGFVFVARMGDALRLGGFLVAPEEIMAHIDSLSGVAASQVVGVMVDGKSRCAAFVMAEAGSDVTADAVLGHCKAALAGYKVPVAVWFVDAFPTTPSPNGTKVQRRKLQDLAQTRLDEPAA